MKHDAVAQNRGEAGNNAWMRGQLMHGRGKQKITPFALVQRAALVGQCQSLLERGVFVQLSDEALIVVLSNALIYFNCDQLPDRLQYVIRYYLSQQGAAVVIKLLQILLVACANTHGFVRARFGPVGRIL